MSDENKPKPWLPSPDDVPDEQGHVWFKCETCGNLEGCKRCGHVKRADGKNRPCTGVLPTIGLRDDGGPDIVTQPWERANR